MPGFACGGFAAAGAGAEFGCEPFREQHGKLGYHAHSRNSCCPRFRTETSVMFKPRGAIGRMSPSQFR